MAPPQPETPGDIRHNQYDWSRIAPSLAVAKTVADAIGTDPSSIPPLCKQIDVDSLDGLLATDRSSLTDEAIHISFSFLDQEVMVTSRGDVYVEPGK